MFGNRIGFLKFKADIFDKETGKQVPLVQSSFCHDNQLLLAYLSYKNKTCLGSRYSLRSRASCCCACAFGFRGRDLCCPH